MAKASDCDILWTRSEEEARKLYGDKSRSGILATGLNRLRLEVLEEARTVTAEGEDVSSAKGIG